MIYPCTQLPPSSRQSIYPSDLLLSFVFSWWDHPFLLWWIFIEILNNDDWLDFFSVIEKMFNLSRWIRALLLGEVICVAWAQRSWMVMNDDVYVCNQSLLRLSLCVRNSDRVVGRLVDIWVLGEVGFLNFKSGLQYHVINCWFFVLKWKSKMPFRHRRSNVGVGKDGQLRQIKKLRRLLLRWFHNYYYNLTFISSITECYSITILLDNLDG